MAKSAPLGQNFLRDEGFARRIVERVPAAPGPVLEIGPGKGALTRLLLERAPGRRLTLVEVDPLLIPELERRFGAQAEVVGMDILRLDLAARFPAGPVTLVGNLPYHISKPLADWLIAQHDRIAAAVLMLQKDFVDKLLASAGGKKYNAQSVVFQLLFRCQRCFDVPAGAFAPAPKVVSTVIAARPAAPPPGIEVGAFYGFARLCFAERRKTLWNNLAREYPQAGIAAAFARLGLEQGMRAEQLAADRFIPLWQAVRASGEGMRQ